MTVKELADELGFYKDDDEVIFYLDSDVSSADITNIKPVHVNCQLHPTSISSVMGDMCIELEAGR